MPFSVARQIFVQWFDWSVGIHGPVWRARPARENENKRGENFQEPSNAFLCGSIWARSTRAHCSCTGSMTMSQVYTDLWVVYGLKEKEQKIRKSSNRSKPKEKKEKKLKPVHSWGVSQETKKTKSKFKSINRWRWGSILLLLCCEQCRYNFRYWCFSWYIRTLQL